MIEIIGHNSIKERIHSSVTRNAVSHAYIFEGTDGLGKTSMAYYMAASCNCRKGVVPCGVCDMCRTISAFSNPDVVCVDDGFINNPKIKANSVDAMRFMKRSVYEKPFSAKRKFYIIPDADLLLPQAQNSILKVFEEPPSYCTIILICENGERLLPTIRSRAVIYRFNPLPDEDMKIFLNKHFGGSDTDRLLRLCGGIPGKATEVTEALEDTSKVTACFERYLKSDGDIAVISGEINKDNIDFMLDSFEAYVSGKLYGDYSCSVSYANAICILQNARRRLKGNCNFTLTVTDMLIKIWEEIHG